MRAWLALPRFRGEALFSTWLYRICLNAVHDERLRAERATGACELEPADPRDPIAERELAGELQQALSALDEIYRVTVVLYDILGCSYAEIAGLLGIPEGTVRSRLYRGRAELARLLGTGEAAAQSKEGR